MIVLVYVDDILVTDPNTALCQSFIQKLSVVFLVKDLGPLYYFLNLEVQRTPEGIFLYQRKYLLDLLQKTNMAGSKPCCTLLSSVNLIIVVIFCQFSLFTGLLLGVSNI